MQFGTSISVLHVRSATAESAGIPRPAYSVLGSQSRLSMLISLYRISGMFVKSNFHILVAINGNPVDLKT